MTIHEEYTALVKQRYDCSEREAGYDAYQNYRYILDFPEPYQTEDLMLAFVKANPNATLQEVIDYFEEVTPDGLAPGDDGSELWDD